MRRVTAQNYKKDKYYPRIVRAVDEILTQGKAVAPVDVFVRMSLLSPENLQNWRFGRIAYLEKAIHCNLEKASRILRILQRHAQDRNLKASRTVYQKWGKGQKTRLRFTKTRDRNIEEAYSTHFVRSRAKAIGEAVEDPKNAEPKPGCARRLNGEQL